MTAVQGFEVTKFAEGITEQAELKDINLYQQQIGSLMYLMTATRPDIAFSVSNCARFMSNPNKEHFNALNRIWQYVKTTKNKGSRYPYTPLAYMYTPPRKTWNFRCASLSYTPNLVGSSRIYI